MNTSKSEVIDLLNPNSTCQDYLPYHDPEGTFGAYGGLLNNTQPVVCSYNFNEEMNQCYFLGDGTPQMNMSVWRDDAQALVIPPGGSTLFATGGCCGDGVGSTSILLTPGQDPVPGPDMPKGMYKHCMAYIDDQTIIIVDDSIGTYIYDIPSQTFSRGPYRIFRNSAACGVSHDRPSGKKVVVVTGI